MGNTGDLGRLDCDDCPAAVSLCDCDDASFSVVVESPADERLGLSVRFVELIQLSSVEVALATPRQRPPDRRAL